MMSKKPTRILCALGGLVRGGAETYLMHVIPRLKTLGFEIDLLTHTDQPCAYDEEARQLGCQIIPCLDPHHPWRYARNFRRCIREHGPYDILHSHLFYFNGLVMYLGARMGIPGRIAHIYPLNDVKDMNRSSLRRDLYRRIATRMMLTHSTSIVACSRTSLEQFRTHGRHDRAGEAIVYCGLDLSRFKTPVDRDAVRRSLGLPTDRPIVTYVARFMPHKNHEQALRVAKLLNQEGYPYHFALAGSHGTCLEMLRDTVRDRQDVSLLVGLEDISSLMQASDAFFFPSLEEGFGLVAVEAAAAGLPIVATDLPTIREACPPSHHGFMFQPNHDVEAASHLARILGDFQLRESLAADARAWAPRFSIESAVDQLAELYNGCLRRAG